eukprot:g13823.t1
MRRNIDNGGTVFSLFARARWGFLGNHGGREYKRCRRLSVVRRFATSHNFSSGFGRPFGLLVLAAGYDEEGGNHEQSNGENSYSPDGDVKQNFQTLRLPKVPRNFHTLRLPSPKAPRPRRTFTMDISHVVHAPRQISS